MTPVDQAERLRHLARTAPIPDENRRRPENAQAAGILTGDPKDVQDHLVKSTARPALKRDANGNERRNILERTKRHRAPFVTITSGKGGVGKSNIAVNLAIALSGSGSESAANNVAKRRITLIDADLGTANADVLCGVNATHNLMHLLQGRRRKLTHLAVEAPGGFRLVPGASGIRRAAELTDEQRALLIREFSNLESMSDLVLIDTGAGISDAVTSMTGLADLVVVVLTPEPTSIADAYGLIKSIHRDSQSQLATAAPSQRFAVLVNMVSSRQQARAVYDRVAAVSRRFLGLQLDYAGYVPQDPAVSRSVLKRTPFLLAYPHAPASRAIVQLAASIAGITLPANNGLVKTGRNSPTSGYLSRFCHWFRQSS